MDSYENEASKFAAQRTKLKNICEAHDLTYTFIKNSYPIKLIIRPIKGVGEQMSMLETASEDSYISPDAYLLFTMKDGVLVYRMSKTFTIEDALFGKIKNIFKPNTLISKIMNFKYTFCIFPKLIISVITVKVYRYHSSVPVICMNNISFKIQKFCIFHCRKRKSNISFMFIFRIEPLRINLFKAGKIPVVMNKKNINVCAGKFAHKQSELMPHAVKS